MKTDRLLRLHQQREARLKQFKDLNAPKCVIENEQNLIAKSGEKLKQRAERN